MPDAPESFSFRAFDIKGNEYHIKMIKDGEVARLSTRGGLPVNRIEDRRYQILRRDGAMLEVTSDDELAP